MSSTNKKQTPPQDQAALRQKLRDAEANLKAKIQKQRVSEIIYKFYESVIKALKYRNECVEAWDKLPAEERPYRDEHGLKGIQFEILENNMKPVCNDLRRRLARILEEASEGGEVDQYIQDELKMMFEKTENFGEIAPVLRQWLSGNNE